MNIALDLSILNTERYFIIGDIRGNYSKLIDLLYEQNFSLQDTLISTGNIIDPDNKESLDSLYFLMNCPNTYSVKGKVEFDIIKAEKLPTWLEQTDDCSDICKFIEELPLVIKIKDNLFVVNSGVEPGKDLEEQSLDVFYNIDEYDSNSRFYQFENPDEKSWYDYEFIKDEKLINFCFGGYDFKGKVPAGYSLGRDINSDILHCLIISDKTDPILIEM